jgi:hypothetical protein
MAVEHGQSTYLKSATASRSHSLTRVELGVLQTDSSREKKLKNTTDNDDKEEL